MVADPENWDEIKKHDKDEVNLNFEGAVGVQKMWINDWLDGNTRRLSSIRRYNNTPVVVPESVAEHSYYVALTAMYLWMYSKPDGGDHPSGPLSIILMRALVHDMEESVSGDMLHHAKRRNPELQMMLRKADKLVMKEIVRPMPVEFAHDTLDLWIDSKDDPMGIVKIADKLSSAFYAMQELRMGNIYFREIVQTIIGLLQQYANEQSWFMPIFNDLSYRVNKEFML